jgi:uncharacterized membrane protein
LEDQAGTSLGASLTVLMLGIFLILIGLFLVLTGVLSPGGVTGAEGGGLIMIGPIPIIFYGRLSPLIILLILVAITIAFLLPLLHLLRLGREREKEESGYT